MPSDKGKSKAQASKEETTMTPSAFSKLSKAEQERRIDAAIASSAQAKMKITYAGRVALFIILPTLCGFVGLSVSYVKQKSSEGDWLINFDRDFIFPFLLALLMVIIIGFRTKGFTQRPAPLIEWPKAKRKKKIIKKLIIWNDIDKDEQTLDKKNQ